MVRLMATCIPIELTYGLHKIYCVTWYDSMPVIVHVIRRYQSHLTTYHGCSWYNQMGDDWTAFT